MWYSPIEQHVNAVYQALLATEALTGPSEVHLSHCWMGACCGCQTQEFGGTVLYSSQMECLPAATHKLSTSPLSHELQQVLGPVLCQAPATTRLIPDMPVSIIRGGKPTIPENTWYADGSCKGQPPTWQAIAYQPVTDSIWMDEGSQPMGRVMCHVACNRQQERPPDHLH